MEPNGKAKDIVLLVVCENVRVFVCQVTFKFKNLKMCTNERNLVTDSVGYQI